MALFLKHLYIPFARTTHLLYHACGCKSLGEGLSFDSVIRHSLAHTEVKLLVGVLSASQIASTT